VQLCFWVDDSFRDDTVQSSFRSNGVVEDQRKAGNRAALNAYQRFRIVTQNLEQGAGLEIADNLNLDVPTIQSPIMGMSSFRKVAVSVLSDSIIEPMTVLASEMYTIHGERTNADVLRGVRVFSILLIITSIGISYHRYQNDILKQDSIKLLTRNSSLQTYHLIYASRFDYAQLLLQMRIPPSHSQSMSLPVALQSSWLTLGTCDIRLSRILFVRPRSCRVALSFPSMLRVLTCT